MKITYTNATPKFAGTSSGPLEDALRSIVNGAALQLEETTNVVTNIIPFPVN